MCHNFTDPDSPKLESVATSENDAIISYTPPEGKNLTFYIKYYPVDHVEHANVIETKATLVKLQGLKSNTKFSLQMFTMENGILSLDSVETFFRTKGFKFFLFFFFGISINS